MRFSTIAISAAAFGATAMAMPGSVVYQTSVVTITSCAPEKTDCPARMSTSAPAVSTVSPPPPPPPPPVMTPTGTPPVVTPPVMTPGCPGGPHCPPPPPVPSSGYSLPMPVHPNSTYGYPVPSMSKPAGTPVGSGPQLANCEIQGPYPTMTNKPVASVIPGTGLPYMPSGTGVPYPVKNTSVPVATTPPTFTGSGSIQSFSILAVGAAVAAFFL
ncbi:hypothetical protein B9Z19DRAFT_1063427 [Tuber borchii]|uniref:GPI anchored serine-rich protein n=1 Tax=Tuber borchii TaxID=42251 RepID=A0A2T6ZY98_TUBBO|nr:hypothetical protein B9Z19DRAFT_1063427 [Tuber borchii]